jgi:hypothetical protein
MDDWYKIHIYIECTEVSELMFVEVIRENGRIGARSVWEIVLSYPFKDMENNIFESVSESTITLYISYKGE